MKNTEREKELSAFEKEAREYFGLVNNANYSLNQESNGPDAELDDSKEDKKITVEEARKLAAKIREARKAKQKDLLVFEMEARQHFGLKIDSSVHDSNSDEADDLDDEIPGDGKITASVAEKYAKEVRQAISEAKGKTSQSKIAEFEKEAWAMIKRNQDTLSTTQVQL